MKTITLVCGLLLGLSFSTPLFSQKVIALHHAGAVSYFTDLSAAYNAAADGDTLYLPGGSFGDLHLYKSLTFIGVGHHPDSTLVTGQTILNTLHFFSGSGNSHIIGVYFNGHVYVRNSSIYGVKIFRCYLNKGLNIEINASIQDWVISENWINSFEGTSMSIYTYYYAAQNNCYISNNVLHGGISGISSSFISNNIFLTYVINGESNTISNNIFYGQIEAYPSKSGWYNNLNAGVNGGPSGSGNTGSGNYLDNAALSSIFANYSPDNAFYQNDFHVVNPAYLGNDGTPVGIYGGPFPWKDGSLPFTPHIRSKTIGATTNPDGTLRVNITVKAQNN